MKRNFFFAPSSYLFLFIYFFFGGGLCFGFAGFRRIYSTASPEAFVNELICMRWCRRRGQGAEPKKFAYRAHLRSVALRLVPERRRLHFADASLFRRRVDPLEKKKNVTKKNRTDRRSIDIWINLHRGPGKKKETKFFFGLPRSLDSIRFYSIFFGFLFVSFLFDGVSDFDENVIKLAGQVFNDPGRSITIAQCQISGK